MGRPKTRRKKGSGSLEKRGNIWHAVWWVDGKKYRESTGKTDKREALQELDRLTAMNQLQAKKTAPSNLLRRIQDIDQEAEKLSDALPALLLEDGFESYTESLQRHEVKSSTLKMYEFQYGRFTKWIKEHHPEITELRQVNEMIAGEFLHTTLTNWKFSGNTYNKYISLLSNIWKTLSKDARIKENPWTTFSPRGLETHSRRTLNVDEIIRVIRKATGELKTLFAVGLYTGMRLEDCCLLDWGHIDLITGYIHPIPRKTKKKCKQKELPVPISPMLGQILCMTPPDNRMGYLLPEIAELYNRNNSLVTARIQDLFADCGIKTQVMGENGRKRVEVGFHSLRHTFVSLIMNSGKASAELVQALVGHGNPEMTRYYFHPLAEGLRGAVNILPNVFEESTQSAIDISPTSEEEANK